MIKLLKDSRREFIAEVLGNMCVLLLSAIVISESFINFNFTIKTSIILGGLALFVFGILICPNKDSEDK